MENDGGMILKGKTEELGEKPVPVLLCPPQIPHGLAPGANPGFRGERPETNRLSHGTAACSWLPIKFIRNDDASQSRRLPLTDGCGLDDRGLIPVLVLEFYFSPAFCVMQSPIQCVPRFMGDKATGA
jgi:hypothetical protein